jgi:hypothetical protein
MELVQVYIDATIMLTSHFQCEYQKNSDKLRLELFIHNVILCFSSHISYKKVRYCLEIDDNFLLPDYDLLVIHLRFTTSFDALYIPLLKETAHVS